MNINTYHVIFDIAKQKFSLKPMFQIIVNEAEQWLYKETDLRPESAYGQTFIKCFERIIVDFKLVNNSLQFSSPTA